MAFASMLCLLPFVKEPLELASTSLISLIWLLAFVMTGDRRLFFPFTMQFAVQALGYWSLRSQRFGMVSAAGVVGLFSVIRLIQSATLIVLLVELVVAAVALWIAGAYYRRGAAGLGRRLVAGAMVSLLAFAGLVF